MDPALYVQGTLNSFSLGFYLGVDGSETEEQRARSNEQGLRLLKHYEVIPERGAAANCPRCGQALHTTTDNQRYGWRYTCNYGHGRIRISPLDNTFLSKARLRGGMTADKVVRLAYMWFLGEPLIKVQADLSVGPETAVSWYGYCRDVACAIAWHDFIPIGGARDVVEVDETHLFKRKYDVGRVNEWRHVWVLGGVSRSTKKRFATIVARRDADTLLPILQQCIDGDSYICTDYWNAYGECGIIFSGHGRVNHSQNFVEPPKEQPPIWMPPGRFNNECLDWQWNRNPPAPGCQPFRIHTQNIERAWRDLKSHLRSSSSMQFASQYIGEWMYRRNILDGIGTRKGQFEKFLSDIKRAYPGVGKVPMKHRYEDILDCDCHECEP